MLQSLIIMIAGLIVLGLLGWRGCMRPDALAAGPSRKVGLVPADLLVALGLMILGPSLIAYLIPVAKPADGAAEPDVLTSAGRILLAQASGQGLPVLYLLWRAGSAPRGLRLIGVIPTRPGRDLVWGVLGFLAAVPLVFATIQAAVLIGELFGQQAPVLAHDMLKMLVDSDSRLGSILIAVSAILVAPILEETIFRGIVQSVMVEVAGEAKRWGVVFIAAFIFAIIHANTATWENWQALPGLFVLGLVLGWLYERSGSLWPGIIVHMGFNTLNIVMALSMVKRAG
ncbi:MAG: type II CAAX endopeptidase family protein [Phycisphaerales bacterium]